MHQAIQSATSDRVLGETHYNSVKIGETHSGLRSWYLRVSGI